MTRWLALCAVVLCVAAVGLPALAPAAQTPAPREDPDSGPALYRTYCAVCHGSRGKGDGVAALRPPPDLTTIAARHGGVFPSDDVARVIDGRNPLPGHLRDDMPRWGAVLTMMENGHERAVQARITALVAHLESLQGPRVKP